MKGSQITVYIPPDLLKCIDRQAERTGQTRQAYIVNTLWVATRTPATPADIAPAQIPPPGLTLQSLKLPQKVLNRLRIIDVYTLEKLLDQTAEDLLDIRNFGPYALSVVQHRLEDYDLELKGGNVW